MSTIAAALEVRPVGSADAGELADLLNAIIAKGGTTAMAPTTAERLDEDYLTGPAVHCCFVAVDRTTGEIAGFQTLGRTGWLPDDVGDIGTFARLGGTQRGIGSALFAATVARARAIGLSAINATIRADNAGGLAFYAKQGFVDYRPATPSGAKGPPAGRVTKLYTIATA